MSDNTAAKVAAARAVLDRDIDPIIESEPFFVRHAAEGIINEELRNKICTDIVAAIEGVEDGAADGR